MEFYDVVKKRKSIKKFKTGQLDRDKLLKIIDAAMRAPSWKNSTPYKFILVDREDLKDIIARSIINKSYETAEAVSNAPATIIIVADPNASGSIEEKDLYLVDSAIAMEHLILAATEEGYGTCWIASFDERKIKEALEIPDNYKVVALTPIGESAEEEEEKPHKPKKDIRDYLYANKWEKSYMDQNVKVLIHH
ncbi:MAG: nitroreductase [Clostridium thermopalmarium]|uniref:nitroreductase family protein n=1 Tax=Clostridium thermopalmarium TaxID=29373 RepID=UPI002355FA2D|nr:nitroreductase family protein [Clostridium thermopalmarium]MBE6044632.1 nitroreductase [Clostridium thermopalmarium]